MEKYYSNTLEDGISLLHFQADQSRYPEGVRLLQKAVSEGEAHACYFLSRCYIWGDGNTKEDEKAGRELLKQGIEMGSSLCVLGAERADMLNGDIKAVMNGSLRDSFQEAERMAKDGEPMAQYAVGLFYFWGDMLLDIQKPRQGEIDKYEKANAKEALNWFLASAKQGCIPAFNNAYNSQRQGRNGVVKDIKAALACAEKLKDHVDLTLHCRDIGSEYEEQEKYKDAIRWYELGISKQRADCINNLALLYLNGNGVKEDEKKAMELFSQAAQMKNPYAYYNLGRCYYNGWGTPQNESAAVENFKTAYMLENDIRDAARFIGVCYYWGRGVETDYQQAVQWSQRAVNKGSSPAKYILGMCYLYGNGTVQNYALAKRLLEENAAESPNGSVFKELGLIYDKGLGAAEDIDMAVTYYQRAVNEGCQEAEELLACFKKTMFGKWKRR